jgi:GNAT superfamily N-acetyltransferase
MTARIVEHRHDDYLITTDRDRLDLQAIHRYVVDDSYWGSERSFDFQKRSIDHSYLVIGAYHDVDGQVGFARMVTDLATFAWLADVYVLGAHQRRGLGTAMVKTIVEHPDLADVTWQFLVTKDAHELYAKFGYTSIAEPERWMHRPHE